MAQKKATLLLKIKETGSKALGNISNKLSSLSAKMQGSGVGKFASSLSGLGRAAFGIVAPIGAAVAAVAGFVVGLGKLALSASAADEVRIAFRNLAESQGNDSKLLLENLKKASKGTITELELMKQANQAALLGLPIERFGEMLNIARSSAKATGQSMDFMLNSIVTGLGRGSKLMLDNLGILVDTNKAYETHARTLGKSAAALTEAERKQAFINEALRIGVENSKKAGSGALSLNEEWQKLKTTMSEWVIAVGNKLIPAFTAIVGGLNKVAGLVQKAFAGPSIEEQKQKLITLQKEYDKWNKILEKSNGLHFAAGGRVKGLKKEIDAIQAVIDKDKERAEQIAQKKIAFEEEQAAKAEHDAKMAELDAKAKEEKRTRDQEDALIKRELREVEDQAEIEALQEQLQLKSETEREAQLAKINDELLNENNRFAQLDLIRQKDLISKIKIDKKDTKAKQKKLEWEKMTQQQKIALVQGTLSQIATLQDSNNKLLGTIGKAAAIAQIIMSTSVGVMRAMEIPFIGPVLAGAVVAAGAAQMAKVQGVKLAEGGIVQARSGGVPAIIGEAGKDEAVIPLDDEGTQERLGMGGGNTFNFNGPVLGTKEEAVEFAKWVDEGLVELRRNNESLAFDEGIT